jgi:hypothetical protein
MKDLTAKGALDFNATEVTFEATSKRAKEFLARTMGHGAVAFTVKKSNVDKSLAYLRDFGFTVEVVS